MLREQARRGVERVLPAVLVRAVREYRNLAPAGRRVVLAHRMREVFGTRRGAAPPRTVLFVCHGNIMRSPVAEALLRTRLSTQSGTHLGSRDVASAPVVRSAGTHARDGEPADPRARGAAAHLGTSVDAHRAQRLTAGLVGWADVIYVMDHRNQADVLLEFPQASGKVRLLGGADGTWWGRTIPDPYSQDPAFVDACYTRLTRLVDRVAETWGPRKVSSGARAGVL